MVIGFTQTFLPDVGATAVSELIGTVSLLAFPGRGVHCRREVVSAPGSASDSVRCVPLDFGQCPASPPRAITRERPLMLVPEPAGRGPWA